MTSINSLPPGVLVALATGRKEIARNLLVKLVKEEPANLPGWLALAVTLPREHALQALRRALILEPENPVALRNLIRLSENHNPGFCLEFSDIWEEQPEEAETPALFGNEVPTLSLRIPKEPEEAAFGEELATMPVAFRSLVGVSARPGSLKIAQEPAVMPQKPVIVVRPPTVEKEEGRSSPARNIAPAQPLKKNAPEETAPVRPEVGRGSSGVELLARSALPAAPEQAEPPAAPSASNSLIVADGEEKLVWPVGRRSRTAALTLAATKPDLTSGETFRRSSNLGSADSGPSSPPPVRGQSSTPMPRLYTGPRPNLGEAHRPAFGFTTFGFLVLLLIILVIILCLLIVMQPPAARPQVEPETITSMIAGFLL